MTDPPERVHLHAPPLDDESDHRTQMNVRLPRTLIDTVDLRRAALGISRDEWVRRALTFALTAPPGTPTAIRSMNGRRTVAPRSPL